MEPFELKLHQVTFEESDSNLDPGQAVSQLDSLSELVHYDANFQDRTGLYSSEDGSHLQDLTFTKSGKHPDSQSLPPNRFCFTTTTATATPTPYRSPNNSGTHSKPAGPRPPLPWENHYLGDSEGQEHFLVNADDYYSPRRQPAKVSPEVAAAGLRTLSQVSFNTSAIARHLRKVKGGTRRVAKTTLTSTALTTPRTMPSETSHPSSTPTTPVATPESATGEGEGGGAGDSSFETVAEALRLQWSVIGNANITPASPEEVAKIVAEAEKRLRGETGSDISAGLSHLHLQHPPLGDARASDLQSTESVSSLSSLSSSTANDNGIPGVDVHTQKAEGQTHGIDLAHKVEQPSETVVDKPEAQLIRIPAASITKEVEKVSWFQSKDKSGVSSSQNTGAQTPRVASDSPNRGTGSGGEVNSSPRGNVMDRKTENSQELTPYEAGSLPSSAGQSTGETLPVSLGTGVSPANLGFQPPVASSTVSYTQAVSKAAGDIPSRVNVLQQASQQDAVSPGQQEMGAQQPLMSYTQQNAGSLSQQQLDLYTQQNASQQPLPLYTQHNAASPKHSTVYTQQSTSLASQQPPLTSYTQQNVVSASQAELTAYQQPNAVYRSQQSRQTAAHQLNVAAYLPQNLSENEKAAFNSLMREKLSLEGELEMVQSEAQSVLQQKTMLQSELFSLRHRLKENERDSDAEKTGLRAELERLRATRLDHEREALEVQQMLEEKLEELKAVTEDLYQSQDSTDKLQVRMKELRDDLQAKEITVQALKSKIAELYVEVQTALQNKMEADSEAHTARNDLLSLVKAKEWYQEQLSTAHEVRAKLQRQLTLLQAQTVSQGSIVERLKMESGRLRQQLRESQERALRDKEQLARHLETIQQDMMEREAAFQEIQRERLMIEDTFNTQVTTVEEEKSRINSLLQLTSEMESQLEQAHSNSKKKQEQIFSLENEQMELMKKTTLVQEVLVEKEQLLEEANQKLIEVESQLEAFTKTLAAKDAELLKLREEKASTEIALKAALQEKESVDKALDTLKGDMGKVEKSFKQMRQELGVRLTELETAQTQQKFARDELDRVAHELDIKNRSVESLTQTYQEQTGAVEQLQTAKDSLQQQVVELKQQLEQAQLSVRPEDASVQQALQTELHETRARLTEMETQLKFSAAQLQQAAATSAPSQVQEASRESEEQLQTVTAERDDLIRKLHEVQEEKLKEDKDGEKQRQELSAEVANLKSQLLDGKTEFESSVQTYVDQLRAVTEEKQRLETELEMTRRRFELSSVQQQENISTELQKLMKELEDSQLQKQALERQLLGLQTEKETEVVALRQQLAEAQRALQTAMEQQQQQHEDTEALNQQLVLELEKEKGRTAGLQQNNATLKEHMKQMEEVLMGQESSLVMLNSQLEKGHREREKEQQDSLKRIQELEVSLKKEKDGSRDLRKQIGSKITENKRLLKQQEVHKREQQELQEEVERRQKDWTSLHQDLETARQAVRDHQEEMHGLQREKHALEAELDRARRELADNADRNPVLVEQIRSLEWQVSQRSQEVDAVREQLALAEQRHINEMDGLRQAMQNKQEEMDSLQAELTAARQEKANQKSRVSELRSVLKASVQHHKLTKKVNARKKEKGAAGDADSREEKATQADMDNGIIIPPLPFDMEAVEKLLMDTAVKPLDSKPLDNLSTCLSSLRAEISGLQKQMEVHTTTIHTSTQSWKSVESEVKGLQEVVRSIANTIMDAQHSTTTTPTNTTVAMDTEIVQEEESGIVHL